MLLLFCGFAGDDEMVTSPFMAPVPILTMLTSGEMLLLFDLLSTTELTTLSFFWGLELITIVVVVDDSSFGLLVPEAINFGASPTAFCISFKGDNI